MLSIHKYLQNTFVFAQPKSNFKFVYYAWLQLSLGNIEVKFASTMFNNILYRSFKPLHKNRLLYRVQTVFRRCWPGICPSVGCCCRPDAEDHRKTLRYRRYPSAACDAPTWGTVDGAGKPLWPRRYSCCRYCTDCVAGKRAADVSPPVDLPIDYHLFMLSVLDQQDFRYSAVVLVLGLGLRGLALAKKFKAEILADYNVHHKLPSTGVNYISRSTFLTYLSWSPMAVRDDTVPASFPTGMAMALALGLWPWPWP